MDTLYLPDVRAHLRYVDLPGRRPPLVYLTGLGLAAWGTYSAATVIAYSFGGAVAITLAAIRPELVAALALAEPNLEPGGGFLSSRIAKQSEEAFRHGGHAELVAESLAKAHDGNRAWAVTSGMMQIASPHGLHRTAVGLVKGTRPTMRERLLALRIPRTIIRGEASGPNPRESELVASGVRLQSVAGAGHGMMWDNPRGFVDAVREAVALSGRKRGTVGPTRGTP